MTSSSSPASSPSQESRDAGAMLAEIRVPRETVNDDTVTIQSWHVEHGGAVNAKQLVVSIETSKAVLEVEAECDGFVEIIKPKGSEVPIGALIGRVLASAPAAAGSSAAHAPDTQNARSNGSHAASGPRTSNRLRDRTGDRTGPSAPTNGSGAHASVPSGGFADSGGTGVPPVRSADSRRDGPSATRTLGTRHTIAPSTSTTSAPSVISKLAQSLIDEHTIDGASAFAGMALVRESDVRRHLEALGSSGRVAPATAVADLSAELIASDRASLDTQTQPARAYVPVNKSATKSGSKGLFGDAASSARDRGNRSVLWLAWNYLWRNWLLGNLVKVAPRGVILPLHKLRGVKMGHDVFIDPSATLETAYPENITIGNDVRITAGCVVMTHIKAPHELRESGLVPNVLKPVVFEDHCFIGVNSVVMPGVTVGRCAVVTSGSVVVTNVPAYSMVQGNPAKVIKQFLRPNGE